MWLFMSFRKTMDLFKNIYSRGRQPFWERDVQAPLCVRAHKRKYGFVHTNGHEHAHSANGAVSASKRFTAHGSVTTGMRFVARLAALLQGQGLSVPATHMARGQEPTAQ